MSSRSSEILFLLGAGASADAGIPVSAQILEIEKLLADSADWTDFRDLYHQVKSSIHYSAGLKGNFNRDVNYNIETLVNSLYELEKNEEHPLYPFIASWNSRFVDLAGRGFENVKKFRQNILSKLKDWMCPDNEGQADYYNGFVQLQNDLNFPLQIFSLNYDLCVERLQKPDLRVEDGFGGYGPEQIWDWERFENTEGGPNPLPQIFLYKLHGSINWKRDEARNLFRVTQVQSIDPNNMEIIFGRDFKLEAADPYLFYAYHFRRHCLMAKLIVTVGYGFLDEHINQMLAQALRRDTDRRLLVVARCEKKDDKQKKRAEVVGRLCTKEGQVVVLKESAKTFLEQPNLAEVLRKLVPKAKDVPF